MSIENAIERPEFDSRELTIPADEAGQHIEDAIVGLSASESPVGVKYRTTGGMLVAIVGHRQTDGGDVKSKLVFRTAPPAEAATRKAKKLVAALEPYTSTQ